jgi:hypothetical protein
MKKLPDLNMSENELKKVCEELVVAPFDVTSLPLHGSSEEHHEKPQSREPVFGARIRTADLSITK